MMVPVLIVLALRSGQSRQVPRMLVTCSHIPSKERGLVLGCVTGHSETVSSKSPLGVFEASLEMVLLSLSE